MTPDRALVALRMSENTRATKFNRRPCSCPWVRAEVQGCHRHFEINSRQVSSLDHAPCKNPCCGWLNQLRPMQLSRPVQPSFEARGALLSCKSIYAQDKNVIHRSINKHLTVTECGKIFLPSSLILAMTTSCRSVFNLSSSFFWCSSELFQTSNLN